MTKSMTRKMIPMNPFNWCFINRKLVKFIEIIAKWVMNNINNKVIEKRDTGKKGKKPMIIIILQITARDI